MEELRVLLIVEVYPVVPTNLTLNLEAGKYNGSSLPHFIVPDTDPRFNSNCRDGSSIICPAITVIGIIPTLTLLSVTT